MPRKPFIDKKKAVTFKLVNRSLKDPLAADEDAPQHVLVPYGAKQKIPDSVSECGTYEYEEMISQRKRHGIGFEDNYDYMQHLCESTENQPAILIPKSKSGLVEVEENDDGMSEIFRDNVSVLKLPSEVFGSVVEEPIGMLFRAIPPKGPQPSWDPEIVAGLDDDFDHDDPDNELDDDFVVAASQPGEKDDYGDMFSSDAESEYNSSSNGSSQFEDAKSQFTHYSLTSSVIRRNDQLTLLDDKFERFFSTYDDSCIGDLAQIDIGGAFPVEKMKETEGMEILLGIEHRNRLRSRLAVDKPTEWNKKYVETMESDASDDEGLTTLVKEEVDKKWDCESILSTYSNLYNHPKIIQEESSKVKVRKNTGVPIDDSLKLTKQQLRLHDAENAEETREVIRHVPNVRRRNETKEERIERKKAVKEAKKERRMEKKATKEAFREEKTRQDKELVNLRQNLAGIRIS